MTEEIRYTPAPRDRRATVLSLSLFFAALVLFLVTGVMPLYGGLLQLMAICLLVPALFVAYKFVLTSYTYILTDTEQGRPSLLIEQGQGRRKSLLCHLPLSAILRIVEEGQALPRGKAYTYVASLGGGTYQYISARQDGLPILLKLEMNAAFLEALRIRAAAARIAEKEE